MHNRRSEPLTLLNGPLVVDQLEVKFQRPQPYRAVPYRAVPLLYRSRLLVGLVADLFILTAVDARGEQR